MLTRLSRAVLKVNAANADPGRYTFLTLENTEPNLGVPAGDNYVLTSNTDGARAFNQIGTLLTGGYGIDVFSNGLIQLDPEIDFNLSNANIVASGVARFDYTTSTPATILSGNDNNGTALQFDANDTVFVYVDGFLLLETEDYTYETGANSKVTLTANTFANSIVSIVRFSPTLFISGTGGTSNANAVIGTIFASNVVENGNTTTGNVFFTNTRARAAFTAGTGITIAANGLITGTAAFTGNTDSVPEGTANLYFTNARAISAVQNNISTTSVSEGINLYFTNARAISAVQNNISTTSVSEGTNLYFTNARVVSAISAGKDITIDPNGRINATLTVGTLPTIFASNVVENGNTTTGNVFFTNARARAAFTAGQNIYIESNGMIISAATFSSLPTIFASNVVENGNTTTGNVFFTNARALAAVQNNITTTSVAEGTNLYFTTQRARDSISAGPGINYDNITGTVYIGTLYTANVTESPSNLYYTNARARQAFTAGQNIGIDANGLISANVTVGGLPTIYTSNVNESGDTTAGNVYFTNARARQAFTFGQGITFNGTTGSVVANVRSVAGKTGDILLNASDIAENGNTTTGNVFFTNIRARQAFTAGNGIILESNGLIIANVASSVVNESISGISNAATLVVGNLIPSSSGERDLGNATHPWRDLWLTGSTIRLGNLVLKDVNGKFTVQNSNANITTQAFTTAEVPEVSSNLYFTNARALAAVQNNISTTSVSEGINLYYTNTRARSAIGAGTGISYDQANGTISLGTLPGGGLATSINASNVIETGTPDTGNVFFTTARARAAVSAGAGLAYSNTTGIFTANVRSVAGKTGVILLNASDINENGNTTTGNVYFTNARAIGAFTAGTGITIAANGLITSSSAASLPTSDVSAGTYGNSYFVGQFTVNANGLITGANNVAILYPVTSVAGKTGEVTLTTSNVTEQDNLYFTNARVYANVIGIINSKANTNDLTTSNITEGTNLYYTNARVYANVIGLINAKANINDLTTSNVAEGNNLYFTNARVYANVISLINAKANSTDLTTSNVAEGNNLYFTNARVYANVIGLLNGKANTTDLTTSNVAEGNNLYFTNTRAVQAFTAGTGITIAANGLITGTAAFSSNTNFVAEGSNNLYFTNARAIAAVQNNISTTSVSEGTNLYFTNTRALAAVQNNITTTSVAEGTNLYFTNARARSALTAGSGITIESNGLVTANVVSATNPTIRSAISVANATLASNVIGYGGISYDSANGIITHYRVTNVNIVSSLISGSGITIESNGRISASVTTSYADSNTRAALSVSNVGVGFGTLDYNSGTGAFTFTRITNTNIRSAISAVNSGTGHGNLSYNESTGVVTLARVTDSNIRLALSGGTGITYSNTTGIISLSQAVDTTANVQFKSVGVGTAASGVQGEIRATNDITAFYSSDKRLKTNIIAIPNAVQIVNNLDGVYFDWIDSYIEERGGEDNFFVKKHDIGLIAQQVQNYIPMVVGKRPDGYLGVKYEKVIPLLVEAIKTLSAEIVDLKEQIKNIDSEK